MPKPVYRTFQKLFVGSLLMLATAAVGSAYLFNQQYGAGIPPAEAAGDYRIEIPLPDFSLTDQHGRTVSQDDLLGKVWIADFVFTSCAGPCATMSRHMQQIQQDLGGYANIRLVSFSVDPERDTPEVLERYARRHQADGGRWFFLTGPTAAIYDLAIGGFKIAVESARQEQQIIHDTRFILVDGRGRIRGYYDSGEPKEMEKLRRDAVSLANRAADE